MTYPVLLPKFFPILSDGNRHANVFSPLSLFYRRTYALRKFVVERVNILAENLGASRKENDDGDDDGHRVRSDTRPENAKSLALDIPLGEIISRATRGNKKGQRARMEVRKDERRRETEREISIRRLRGGRGIIASIISAGCTRPLFLGKLPLPLFLSSSLPIYLRCSGLSHSLPLSISTSPPFFIFGSMSAPGRKRPDV